MPTLRAIRDPAMTARIIRRWPIIYRDGADPRLDRPAHVRAASGLAWVDGRLAVVQDDTNFLAFIEAAGISAPSDSPTVNGGRGQLLADAVTLPAGPDGRRQFDDGRGNKAAKLDLESCITVPDGDSTTLIAFGSGSTSARERILAVALRAGEPPGVRLIPAPALYAALRAATEFAGSELNIEGAVLTANHELRLFGRGNGAARDGRDPVNATCTLDWPALWAALHDPSAPAPTPRAIQRYDLGAIDDVPLGFTDAADWDGEVIYTAAAEDSPDAVADGRVAGSALGLIPRTGAPRYAVILDEHGQPFAGKIEGVACGTSPHTVLAAADEDDPDKPSELCLIALRGFTQRVD